jgi:hypothetical protein
METYDAETSSRQEWEQLEITHSGQLDDVTRPRGWKPLPEER